MQKWHVGDWHRTETAIAESPSRLLPYKHVDFPWVTNILRATVAIRRVTRTEGSPVPNLRARSTGIFRAPN
jgi:hypothetical protein